jgi:hypothetical protein
MGRKPEVPGKPATERLALRLNPQMLEWLDTHRGNLTRSAFLRSLIRQAAKEKR